MQMNGSNAIMRTVTNNAIETEELNQCYNNLQFRINSKDVFETIVLKSNAQTKYAIFIKMFDCIQPLTNNDIQALCS